MSEDFDYGGKSRQQEADDSMAMLALGCAMVILVGLVIVGVLIWRVL